MLRGAAILGLCAVLCGCGSDADAPLAVYVVDAEGGNPLAGLGAGRAHLTVDQGGSSVFDVQADVRGGAFDIAVPIASIVAATRIQMVLDLEGGQLLGATPSFIPLQYGMVRVVVGPPGRCAAVEEPRLPSARLDLAAVAVDSNALLFGGTSSDAVDSVGHDLVAGLSLLELTYGEALAEETSAGVPLFPALPVSLRQTQAVRLPDGDATAPILVLGETLGGQAAFVFDALAPETASPSLTGVHEGAGVLSTIVGLGADGAAIVGGAGGEGASSVTWVQSPTSVSVSRLAVPRQRPAVAFVGGGLLVAGGQPEGAARLEFVPIRGDGQPVPAAGTGALDGALWVRDPARATALLVGGDDVGGSTVTTTMLARGCPACVVSEGPRFDRARRGAAHAETPSGTWLLGGVQADGTPSPHTDLVSVQSASASIDALGDLPTGRARASALPLASGVVLLVGGMNPSMTPERGLAICWPRALDALR